MVQGQAFLKVGGLTLSYLFFSSFIIFTFKNKFYEKRPFEVA